MRRILFTLAATMALAAMAPATALARHHRHHHRSHHARTHHPRVRRFGDANTQVSSTTPTSSENAGTVQSFSGGVLTIMLNDGSTVSGMVTDQTELECEAADMSSSTVHEDGDGGGGDHSGSGDDQSGGGDDQGDRGEDQGDENENEGMENCSTSDLTPGTVVHEAELRLSGSGATWEKVELLVPGAGVDDDD